MRTIHIPLERDYGIGTWSSTEDLLIRGPLAVRATPHVVHYYDETAQTRREQGGPILPGPFAIVIPRYQVPDPAPIFQRADYDDLIEVAGHIFAFHVTDELIALDLVESPVGAHS